MLALLLTENLYAKSDNQFPDNDSLYKKQCITEIVASPVTKSYYPGLLGNFELLKQIDNHCGCTEKSNQKVFKQAHKDKIASLFSDPSVQMEQVDQCALNHLDNEGIALVYAVKFNNYFYPLINSLLEGFHPQSIRQLASVNSYNGHFTCLQDKIKKKCSKIQGLKTTYQCIQSTIRNTSEMNTIKKECPRFQTRDREIALEETQEVFI